MNFYGTIRLWLKKINRVRQAQQKKRIRKPLRGMSGSGFLYFISIWDVILKHAAHSVW